MPSHQWLAEMSQWFWPALANHLWQTTLLALLVWLALWPLKQAPAHTRYAVWLLVFAKLLLPSTMLLFALQRGELAFGQLLKGAELPETGSTIIFQAAQPLGEIAAPFHYVEFADGEAATTHNEFYCLITGVWLLGAILLLAIWLVRRRRLAEALRTEQVLKAGREFELLQGLCERLGINREVSLKLSSGLAEPGVWRVWRPEIVLPVGMTERLSAAELEAVLLHELVHIRHWDNLLAMLQMFVCCLFWFHPLVWLIDRRLLAERELVCDEEVVCQVGGVQTYATSLWKVAQFGLGWPVAGVSRATGSNLKRRIEHMLKTNYPQRLGLPQRLLAGLTVLTLVALSFALGALPRAAVWAQGQQSKPGDNRVTDGGPARGIGPGVGGGVGHGVAGGIGHGAGDGAGKGVGAGNGIGTGVGGGIAGGIEEAKTVQPTAQEQQDTEKNAKPDKWQLIEQAPLYTVQVDNGKGAPLLISYATVNAMIDEENQARRSEKQAGEIDLWLIRFNVMLLNQTSRSIKGISLAYEHPAWGQNTLSITSKEEKIAPNGSLEFGQKSLIHFMVRKTIPFAPAEITVRVARVEFLDGSVWEAKPAAKSASAAPQDEALPSDLYEAGPGLRPTILSKAKAEYTSAARNNKIEGVVILNVIFRSNGKITNIRVVRGLPDGLTEQAIEAARKIKFEPASKDGQPVSIRANLEYSFNLYNQ